MLYLYCSISIFIIAIAVSVISALCVCVCLPWPPVLFFGSTLLVLAWLLLIRVARGYPSFCRLAALAHSSVSAQSTTSNNNTPYQPPASHQQQQNGQKMTVSYDTLIVRVKSTGGGRTVERRSTHSISKTKTKP